MRVLGCWGCYGRQTPLHSLRIVHWHIQVGKGSQLKLVINMMMGAIMAANAEGIELAQGLGLPVESLIEVVNMGAMGTPMFKLKVRDCQYLLGKETLHTAAWRVLPLRPGA